MKGCSACIHVKVCEFHEVIADVRTHPRGERCGFFSEAIGVPCEFGAEVFTVSGGRVVPIKVCTIGKAENGSWNINYVSMDASGRGPTAVIGAVFGENVYKSREEANKALKGGRDGGQ